MRLDLVAVAEFERDAHHGVLDAFEQVAVILVEQLAQRSSAACAPVAGSGSGADVLEAAVGTPGDAICRSASCSESFRLTSNA